MEILSVRLEGDTFECNLHLSGPYTTDIAISIPIYELEDVEDFIRKGNDNEKCDCELIDISLWHQDTFITISDRARFTVQIDTCIALPILEEVHCQMCTIARTIMQD